MLDEDQLVWRVNVVYHDVEGAIYQNLHPEIFDREAARWTDLAARYLSNHQPITLLDIGCGTGFVGMQIGPSLTAADRLLCADVSSVMLEVARSNLSGLSCQVGFLQLQDKRFPLPDASCDVVAMNATLHHIADLKTFFHEMSRVLRPGGRALICHEPNKSYYASPRMQWTTRLVGIFLAPRQAIGGLLRRLGIIDGVRALLRRVSSRDQLYNRTLEQVNRVLLEEGSISQPLTQDQLTALVDIHSPTAGGFHADRGIDLPTLARDFLPDFTLEEFKTYNHLGDHLSQKNGLTRKLNARLAASHPNDGATLVAVLRKK